MSSSKSQRQYLVILFLFYIKVLQVNYSSLFIGFNKSLPIEDFLKQILSNYILSNDLLVIQYLISLIKQVKILKDEIISEYQLRIAYQKYISSASSGLVIRIYIYNTNTYIYYKIEGRQRLGSIKVNTRQSEYNNINNIISTPIPLAKL